MQNNLQDLLGKWGGADFHIIASFNKKDDVHPDDWDALSSSPFHHSYHQCIGIDGKYLILQFGDEKIRVTPEHFEGGSLEPEFKPLEDVIFFNSKGTLEFGIIKGIHYHYKESRFFYDVEVNHKIKGRRYYAGDLERTKNGNHQ
jgi:hypothetical protein